jgi:hypothetical protein
MAIVDALAERSRVMGELATELKKHFGGWFGGHEWRKDWGAPDNGLAIAMAPKPSLTLKLTPF